uniref:Plus3 domain-containing protein n=1 Tax=Hanusia phi TaxID=3032 RepID=A0A7S0HX71_9CRYP|mmetsp:Transcript_554/g.1269  ORF Transcript_554/g.1269 Transcript_554/m.1269 type:complete len:685 (+) Transcript_554:205-2259(+)
MSFTSRSEQRQLERAMKESREEMEKQGKKAEPAPAAPVPGRKAGKTLPKQAAQARGPVGKKSVPSSGKKRARKVQSSSSSSSSSSGSEDESPAQESSSSSDSEVEPKKTMPVKKRGRAAASAPVAHDSESSSEFEDEYDEDYFKNEDDKKWMMSLNELEREAIISERRESQTLAKEAWMVRHKKKKEGLNQVPAASVASSQASRTRRDVKPADDKKQQKKAALEDMEVRKTQDQTKKARLKAAEDDGDDEERSPRAHDDKHKDEPHFEKSAKPRHRQIHEEFRDYPRVAFDKVEAARVSRDRLLDYVNEPFFGEFVQGLFARVNLGENSQGENRYILCQIIGLKEVDRKYDAICPKTKRKIPLQKLLCVTHAGQQKKIPMTLVSNKAFLNSEVDKWCKDVSVEREKLPTDDELEELKAKLEKRWKEQFKYDTEIVEQMLNENQKKGRTSGNVALNKLCLHDEMEEAWEDYKQLADADPEKKDAAYQRWEDLRERVNELERKEKEQQETAQKGYKSVNKINQRNHLANRTVSKKLESSRNITCTRHYQQTVYFQFGGKGEDADARKIAEDDRFKGEAMKASEPTKSGLDVEAEIDDDDEEEKLLLLKKSSAPSSEMSSSHSLIIKQAHAEHLDLEIDMSATKKQDDAPLLVRTVNPLKPVDNVKVSSGGGKKLSLDDYKRRLQKN